MRRSNSESTVKPATEPVTPPITVRVSVALQMTGLSRTKLYALIKAKEIEIVKVGSATLIVVDSIYRFVERERR